MTLFKEVLVNNPHEMLASFLQTGFLTFTVYLTAVILKTLLVGRKAMLDFFHRKDCNQECTNSWSDEDCIDGSGEDDVDIVTPNILTVPITYPEILPPPVTKNDGKDQVKGAQMELFTAENLNDLIGQLQTCVTNFETDYAIKNGFSFYFWRVAVNAQSTKFNAADFADNLGILPVVTVGSVRRCGTCETVPPSYPFGELRQRLIGAVQSYSNWKDRVHVVWTGDDYPVTQQKTISSSCTVSSRTTAHMSLTSPVPWQLHRQAILKHN